MTETRRVIAHARASLFRRRGQAGDSAGAVRERIAEVGHQYRYHAFISYSRHPDLRLARRLRQSLRSVAAHWWEPGRMRVFLDKASLAAGNALDDRLTDALDNSATLILVASANSAASPWVRREVEYWRGLGREILIANAGDGIAWSATAGDFDWDASPSLSRDMLGGAFAAEPAWEDLSRARRHPLLHPGVVRDGAASLAASILGVAKESLLVHELRRQRARVATVVVAAVAAVATATVSLLASSLATQESGFTGGYVRAWQLHRNLPASGTAVPPSVILVEVVIQFDTPAHAAAVEQYFRQAPPIAPTTSFAVPARLAGYGQYQVQGSGSAASYLYAVVWASRDRIFDVGIEYPAPQRSAAQVISVALAQAGAGS